MAVAVWPPNLPILFDAASYRIRENHTVVESPTDRARPKSRRRFDDVIVRRSLTLRFTASQRVTWDEHLEAVAGGALPFEWPHPGIGGRVETVRLIVPEDGYDYRQVSTERGAEMAFEVAVVLEVQP